MYTPGMLLLRYSWGGVGWGCVHVPSTCTRWWCTRQECYCYGIHGVGWGGAVFTFLQLAHAGNVHARNVTATVFMGWGGVVFTFLQLAHAGDVNARNVTATVSMGWGGVVFTFLQLAHAGDVHARNVTATVFMGWGGVGLCSRSVNLHTVVMIFGVDSGVASTKAMCSPASASYANKTDQKDRKKRKKGVEWATHANTLQITVDLKKKYHLRRALQSFAQVDNLTTSAIC